MWLRIPVSSLYFYRICVYLSFCLNIRICMFLRLSLMLFMFSRKLSCSVVAIFCRCFKTYSASIRRNLQHFLETNPSIRTIFNVNNKLWPYTWHVFYADVNWLFSCFAFFNQNQFCRLSHYASISDLRLLFFNLCISIA